MASEKTVNDKAPLLDATRPTNPPGLAFYRFWFACFFNPGIRFDEQKRAQTKKEDFTS